MSIVIPKIKDTDRASASTFNAPITAIESHLNDLSAQINNVAVKSAIIAHDCIISGDCFVGSLVYFDKAMGEFRPTLAVTGDITEAISGRYIASPSAAVVGMVVRKSGDRLADILISGRYSSRECVSNCLTDGTPGSYYLSDKYPGKASTEYGIVVQPVLTYVGGDEFILNITHQMPYQYTGPILRGVTTSSDLIAVSADNKGVVTVGTNEWVDSGNSLSPFAISSIDGRYYRKTPVITNVVGTGQIKTEVNYNGELTIGDINSLGGKIQAYEYNLNGTKRVSDDIYTYIVFPSQRKSSITFSSRVSCTGKVKAYVWAHGADNSNKHDIIAQIYVLKDPKSGSDTRMPGSYDMATVVSILPSKGHITMATSSDYIEVDESCYIFVRLVASDPTEDIRIIDAGITLEPSDNAYSITTYEDRSRLTESLAASENIIKDQVVGINKEGLLAVASCDNPDISAVGVALTSTVTGDICSYTTYGTHNTTFRVHMGSTYFVGTDGSLTTVMPESPKYAQSIGIGIGVNQIRIDIEDRIF